MSSMIGVRARTNGRNHRRNERGLTLLEVLAAVMIFAMVMTVLISTSTNAVHHIGQSARRIDADQVADRLLSDLEIQIRQGLAPEIENDEFTEEPYSIQITMTDLIPSESAAGSAGPTDGAGAAFGGDALSMLGGTLPEVAGYLRQYDIEVSWIERGIQKSVLRTTFAYDWAAAQIELAGLVESASAAGGFGEDDTPDSDETVELGDALPINPRTNCNARNAGECQRNSTALNN